MLGIRLLAIVVLVSASHGQDDISKSLARLVLDVARYKGEYGDLIEFESSHLPDERQRSREPKVDIPGVGGNTNPKVDTTSGQVEGTSEDSALAFYEIPYAEAPVGEMRFQAPQPITTPRGEIDARRNNGLQCHQFEINCVGSIPGCALIEMDEDCLVLNVFVPSSVNLTDPQNPLAERLPVMFYIHGGYFHSGAGTVSSLDGKELARTTNTVVVTINYRLGALGFLVHRETGHENIEGNQGLKDQQLALQWVQNNIASFGGDKNRVTLFGNSAGAQSIMFHTLSSVSKSMYAGAIQQSNPAVFSYQTSEDSQQITNYLLKALRCNESMSERECLLAVEPTAITNRQYSVMLRSLRNGDTMGLVEPHRPVIDGLEFTDNPLHLFRDGKWNSDKNMIVGVGTQELEDIQFYLPENLPFNKGLFTAVNYILFGIGMTDKIVEKYENDYPPGEGEDWVVTFGLEMSHLFFLCPSRAMARYASETTTNSAGVYFYANDHPVLDSTCRSRNNGSDAGCYYSTHADEILYVFRTVGTPSEEDEAVEDHFSTYWGSFARTGSPSNGLETSLGDFVNWPIYTSDFTQNYVQALDRIRSQGERGRYYATLLQSLIKAAEETGSGDELASEPWQSMRIQAQSEVEGNFEENICDFWDSVGYYMDPIPLPTTTTVEKWTTSARPITSTTSRGVTSSEFSFWKFFLACVLAYYTKRM